MAGFLFDCLSDSDSLKYACGTPIEPKNGAVFAPFVELGFYNAKEKISVGNNSGSSGDNSAVIKSFEYGFTDGAGVKIEILDEEGSSLNKFVNRLNKTLCNGQNDYKMFVDFGWLITDCEGRTIKDAVSNNAERGTGFIYFLPMGINVSFDSGKIKYTVEGVDMQNRLSEKTISEILGKEDNKIPLKQAIENLFKDNCPKVNIEFKRRDGTVWDYAASDGGKQGPKSVWTADNQSALATARRWTTPCTTKDGKGVVFQWDQSKPDPTLVIMEDLTPVAGENDPICKRSIGTYIVNGSNCSPVLQFSPTISWVLAANSNAKANPGATTPKGATDNTKPESETSGKQAMYLPASNELDYRAADDIPEKGRKALDAHIAATRFREVPSSIEAELKIIGDPSLAFPLGGIGIIGKSVSIIVINPFYVRSTAGTAEWLARPNCNEILSNKNWMVLGANHQIKEGSFVTTLKLLLVAPNSEVPSGTPIGGVGSGGLTFDNDKSKGA